MKNLQTLLVSFIVILGLNSCEIREPESKPDFARTGIQMFSYANENIVNQAMYFDMVLFIDAYKNSSDSMKIIYKDQYYSQFKIKKSLANNWYVISSSASDTVYTIVTDSNSIHKPGAEWLINVNNSGGSCSIKCISDKKWQITMNHGNLRFLSAETELNLKCTDSIAPLLYQTANFKITGNGVLTSSDLYLQQVRISFQIKDSLIHNPSNWMFTQGCIDVSATDLETDKTESTNGRYYVNSSDNENEIEITYHNRTQVYKGWDY